MKNFNVNETPTVFRSRETVENVLGQILPEVRNKMDGVVSKLAVEAVSLHEIINATKLKSDYKNSAINFAVLEEACDIASNPDIINALEDTSSGLPMMAIVFLSNKARQRKYSVRGLVTGLTASLVRSPKIGDNGQIPPDLMIRFCDGINTLVH